MAAGVIGVAGEVTSETSVECCPLVIEAAVSVSEWLVGEYAVPGCCLSIACDSVDHDPVDIWTVSPLLGVKALVAYVLCVVVVGRAAADNILYPC